MSDAKWLMAREIPRLRRYALALVNDPAAADDLVQDTLERAMRKRHLWTGRGSLRGWLYRMQYNIFVNQTARRRRRRSEIELEDAPPLSHAPTHDARLAVRDVMAAMSALPVEQRAAIALTAVEGLPYDEAARALGIRIGTLRSRIARGREQLRDIEAAPPERAHLKRIK
ncbi:MAG: RNA polymerase sigma factor [Pseudomonadota bacterium]